MLSHQATKDVILEVCKLGKSGTGGVITLNRPAQLNAINIGMAKAILPQLKAWDKDDQIKMVMVKSSSEKAFCAGGDIKQIISAGKASRDFFRAEYTINHGIGTLTVPYVALINGVMMGGGCGISIHGNFRVVTERAVFAMPETAIGFFPDVGASHFLPRCPGSLGLFLGLTGHRLFGRDIFKAGIATHFVPSDKLHSLEEELMRLENPNVITIDSILSKYQEQWEIDYRKEFSLKPYIGRINSIFGQAGSVEEIIQGLQKDNTDWAKKQIETLRKMSPTSLKVTFEQLKRGKSLSLSECLNMEYAISVKFLEDNSDFYEGVRALLVDKDKCPKWRPSTLEEVTDEMVQSYFQPLRNDKGLEL